MAERRARRDGAKTGASARPHVDSADALGRPGPGVGDGLPALELRRGSASQFKGVVALLVMWLCTRLLAWVWLWDASERAAVYTWGTPAGDDAVSAGPALLAGLGLLAGPAPWVEAVLGLAADLGAVLLWVSLRRAAPRARWPAWGAGVALALRVLDLGSCVAAGAHVSPAVWWHLEPGAWRVAMEAGAPVLVGLALGAGFAATRAARRVVATERSRRGAGWLAAALALGLVAPPLVAPRSPVHLGGMPEVDVPRSWLTHVGWRAPVASRPPTDGDLARWRARGWLPRPELQGAAAPPDQVAPVQGVIVVLLESMNAGFSGAFVSDAPLDTPGLRRVRARGVTVGPYVTQSRPTHNGLVASLCGLLPGTWPLDAAAGRRVPKLPGCLPRLVRDRGGSATFVHGGPLAFTGLDVTLRRMGFDRLVGRTELEPDAEPDDLSPWGVHDRAVYDRALAEVDRLGRGARPFVLVVSTLDGHAPGNPHPRCALAAGASLMLRAQACADSALDRFVQALEAKGALSSTALVVTSDHAAPAAVSEALLPRTARGRFAPLPLVIVAPRLVAGARHRRLGGQLDLAATVAPLLGLRAPRGQDLLAPSPAAGETSRVLLSTSGRRWVGVSTARARAEAPLARLGAACHRDGPQAGSGPLACDAARFLRALDAAWHTDTLTAFFGAPAAPANP